MQLKGGLNFIFEFTIKKGFLKKYKTKSGQYTTKFKKQLNV